MGRAKRGRRKHNAPYFPSYAEYRLGHTHMKAEERLLTGRKLYTEVAGEKIRKVKYRK